jgi:hypothetical protein
MSAATMIDGEKVSGRLGSAIGRGGTIVGSGDA